MNARGYYWCDRCDDNAYGKICRHCQLSARWIASPPAKCRVADTEAKTLFQAMREAVTQP